MDENRPKVVMGADPLLQSATGIGTYTRNLVRHLKSENLTEDLKLFANGVFLPDDVHLHIGEWQDNPLTESNVKKRPGSAQLINSLARLRPWFSKRRLAVNLFNKAVPLIEQVRLRPFRDYIFHSPNYLLPKFSGPSVVTIHDLSIQRYPDYHPPERVKFLEAQIAAAAEGATHLITDSVCVREEVIEYFGVDDSRVTSVPLAADEQYRHRTEIECREILTSLRLRYKRFYLFASTIEPRKNLLRICAAYKSLRAAGKTDWPIIFVGGPGWRSEAEHREIRSLVDRGWARYMGFVESSTLPILYSCAGALVFPSIYEGFGLPALEARQSCTRVITSQHSAMAEYANEYDLLVDPLEVDSLKEAMEAVIGRVLEDNGQPLQCVGSGLSWQKTARLTSEVYEKVLATRT